MVHDSRHPESSESECDTVFIHQMVILKIIIVTKLSASKKGCCIMHNSFRNIYSQFSTLSKKSLELAI